MISMMSMPSSAWSWLIHRLTTRQIAFNTDISQERADHILKTVLKMTKVSARRVPLLLTPDQKRIRMNMSRENLELMEMDRENFLARFVTMNESWVHHFEPETKDQSKQWKHPDSPTPRKAKVTASAGKVMASVFWDAQGVLLVDYLPKIRPSTVHTMLSFCASCGRKSRRRDAECCEKESSFSRIMCRITRPPLPWPKSASVGSNCSHSRFIHQIWLPPTSTSSPTWRRTWLEGSFPRTTMSWTQLPGIWRPKIRSFITGGSWLFNTAGLSVLTYMVTML